MRLQTIAGLCLALAVCAGCAKNQEYKSAFDKAMKEKTGSELFNALLDLDQRYPDTFALKSALGETLMASGDLDKAETYLKRAAELSSDADTDLARSAVALDLGILRFEKKDYAAALAGAQKALALTPDDPRGAVFLKARSHYELGKKDEAIALYEKNWVRRSLMSRLDLNVYFDESLKAKNSIRALDILQAYQEQFDFTAGQGIQASQLYEKLGLIDEAVLSAAMELEYLNATGKAGPADVRARLAAIGKKLDDKGFNPKGAGKELLKGLTAFFNDDWNAADKTFSGLNIGYYYFAYLKLAARLEAEGAAAESLKPYVEEETYFKSLPTYYYHLWRGMKKGNGTYTFDSAKEVLEQAVLLAPATQRAKETRREIGRLLGLDPFAGDGLILPQELAALGARLVKGEPAQVLDPAVGLLALPDNVYTMQGMVFLRELSRNLPAVNAYLEKKRAGASGRLKERLVMILQG